MMKKTYIIMPVMTACFWAITMTTVYAACNVSIIATAPDSRYTDNGGGTVTDKVTGLMWKQCSEGQSTITAACDTGTTLTYTWQGALQQVVTLNNSGGFASYTDWRLPNRNELASLQERQCFSPAINTNLFPNTLISAYWSSSPHFVRGNAWGVSFGSARVYFYTNTSSYGVRLVRGGS